jgi:nitrous oxide reductase
MNNLLLIPAARAQSTNANITTTSSSTNQTSFASLSNKTFYLFTAEHEGLNEEKLGIPEDAYSPTTFVVNEGDNVTIHFYNLDTSDRHTFTIGAPYNINLDLLPLHNGTTTFKATQEGVFRFLYISSANNGRTICSTKPAFCRKNWSCYCQVIIIRYDDMT